jgi:hypothetical protein
MRLNTISLHIKTIFTDVCGENALKEVTGKGLQKVQVGVGEH